MDVLLDVLDTFIYDRLYATVLPVPPGTAIQPSLPYNDSLKRYIDIAPSKWALLSRWPREFVGRQFFSLFLMMW